ncbi:hypothetical protein UFOVP972_232 [uncultured Caudovirales phage]|uniref:Uncharacterized protein n=1 Tax=uncultured Caudovirales phage TaxID=2100421 RepID=A0A6J5PWE7_9CAUD|nr:hypothetical protein UFOVP972_232 [uncultured Caudovirales phage]
MSLITRQGKDSKLSIVEMDNNLTYLESLGLAGTKYIFVAANGTPTENATDLHVAYDKAKTMSPSQPNRITIICGPGKYEFPNSSPFTLDAAFIDLVSLTGNRDVFLYTTSSNTNLTTDYNIDISTDNVFVKGVDASTPVWVDLKGGLLVSGSFKIANSLDNLICENCKGQSNPLTSSFGGNGSTASGTFMNCVGGYNSFGGNGSTVSGTFTNCVGSYNSFGGNGSTASGTFTNCVGGSNSFGGSGTASGTFTNCIGDTGSFGGGGTASGTFTNCISGNGSFGDNGTLSGKLFYCRLTTGTFNAVSGSGKTLYCIDGNNDPNNQGFTPQNIV